MPIHHTQLKMSIHSGVQFENNVDAIERACRVAIVQQQNGSRSQVTLSESNSCACSLTAYSSCYTLV